MANFALDGKDFGTPLSEASFLVRQLGNYKNVRSKEAINLAYMRLSHFGIFSRNRVKELFYGETYSRNKVSSLEMDAIRSAVSAMSKRTADVWHRQEQTNDITIDDLREALAALARQIKKLDPSFDYSSIGALSGTPLDEGRRKD
jgi:hypothetical protein